MYPRYQLLFTALTFFSRISTDLFNKAYNHISERIDEVYKDLTKGKAAPMGGVAYLSLEDNEVGHKCQMQRLAFCFSHFFLGTICGRY